MQLRSTPAALSSSLVETVGVEDGGDSRSRSAELISVHCVFLVRKIEIGDRSTIVDLPPAVKCGQDTTPVKTSNAQHHSSHLSVGVAQPETTPEIVLSGHRQRPIAVWRNEYGASGDPRYQMIVENHSIKSKQPQTEQPTQPNCSCCLKLSRTSDGDSRLNQPPPTIPSYTLPTTQYLALASA
ncbi:unnamed protein product [Polarella glacialis]|uniref:Uncharacterized protein n=1 Tax=Polarella glacialis TaxID=89957 RepID=A0A813LCK7_POLGL|nr:unnamed protein product [Polarella glacialis]